MAAPRDATLAVTGYKDLLKALKNADRDQRKAVRHVLRQVGEAVWRDAVRDMNPVDSKSAGGYKVYVRQRGVGVEQSLRKTTGVHPEWGGWQMRHALLPALEANENETERRMEQALDVVCATFNRGGPV